MWDRGIILSSVVTGKKIFPCPVPLKSPSPNELATRFGDVRDWIISLNSKSAAVKNRGYRVELKTVNNRMLGTNDLPSKICIDTIDDAVYLLNKNKELHSFLNIIESAEKNCPPLLAFLESRPLRALSSAAEWDRILSVVIWVINRKSQDIYLRQIDLPGVHTKFIEQNRSLISELLDIVLPSNLIDDSFSATGNFARRYGFKTPPLLVRFRPPSSSEFFSSGISDVSLRAEEFAQMKIECGNALVVENQINFLALPHMENTIVIWGAGYGFENLAPAIWLKTKKLYYWGDIDTHGFAIFNQFRKLFPAAESFLMDSETLLEHIDLCIKEPAPTTASLQNLTNEETMFYKDIRENLYGDQIRLEQERISYGYIIQALKNKTEMK
jgi:hypothetical protein